MSSRRTNDGSSREIERSTAGAAADGDHERIWHEWQRRAWELQEALNAIPGVSARVEVSIRLMEEG